MQENVDQETGEVQEVYTEESLFEEILQLHNQIWDIEMDLKDILKKAKDQGVEDVTLINSIAKAKAGNKIGDLRSKMQKKLEMIDDLA